VTTKRNTGDLATVEEAAAELANMSDANVYRLEQFARLRALGFAWLDWRDVLHEAIDRVLSGSRRWPRSVPFIAFMCGVIRSVTSELWRARSSRPENPIADLAHDTDGRTVADEVIDRGPGPEKEVIARDILQHIAEVFEDDSASLGIIRGLAEGLTPEEIQQQEKLNARQYASARKRIRRSLARALREGAI
jgi:DNA-directed RNA polymerase specialized sigma24 family protein